MFLITVKNLNFIIICKWKLHFLDIVMNVESPTCYSIYKFYYFRDFLLSKNKYFESNGYKFSHISEMNITFIADLTNTTYNHYLKISKPMIEWTIITNLAKNLQLIKAFDRNTSRPLIRKCSHNNDDEEI